MLAIDLSANSFLLSTNVKTWCHTLGASPSFISVLNVDEGNR